MYKKEESKMTLRFLSLANCNVDLPSVKMKHTEGIANLGRNTEFILNLNYLLDIQVVTLNRKLKCRGVSGAVRLET